MNCNLDMMDEACEMTHIKKFKSSKEFLKVQFASYVKGAEGKWSGA